MKTLDELKSELVALKQEQASIQESMNSFSLDDYDFYDAYDESLNCNGTVTAGGMEFDVSRVLKELDEHAYTEGYNAFTDAMDKEQHSDYKELEERDNELDDEIYDLQNQIEEEEQRLDEQN